MRHRLGNNTLGHSSDERRRLVRMLVRNFLRSPDMTMVTTKKRAGVLMQTMDKLVTAAKTGTTAGKKKVQSLLDDRSLTKHFMDTVVSVLGDRTSGYTRRILLQNRAGDLATLARVEWVNKIIKPVTKGEVKDTGKKEKPSKDKATKSKKTEVKTAKKKE